MATALVQQKQRETAFGQQLPSGNPARSCCQRGWVLAEQAGRDAEEQQLGYWSASATPALHFSRQDFVLTPPGFMLATSVAVIPAAPQLFGLAPLSHSVRNRGGTPRPAHVDVPTCPLSLPSVWVMMDGVMCTALS